MIPAFKEWVHDLLWSPERFRLWSRGFLGWSATIATQIALTPTAELVTWGAKAWAIRLLIAAAAGGALLIPAGQRNPPAPPTA